MALPPDRDAHELERFGYAQELVRRFGGFSSFAIGFSVISVVTGVTSTFGDALAAAGPAGLGLGWPPVVVGTMLVALAISESRETAAPTRTGGAPHVRAGSLTARERFAPVCQAVPAADGASASAGARDVASARLRTWRGACSGRDVVWRRGFLGFGLLLLGCGSNGSAGPVGDASTADVGAEGGRDGAGGDSAVCPAVQPSGPCAVVGQQCSYGCNECLCQDPGTWFCAAPQCLTFCSGVGLHPPQGTAAAGAAGRASERPANTCAPTAEGASPRPAKVRAGTWALASPSTRAGGD